ncbi:MAG: efflux RND transporter permease subunit [Acidobacteriota bacterium]
MSLPALSIRRPVATTMGFLILIVLGAASFLRLPVDLLPQIEFTQLTVRTSYPNVGPEEIEKILTDPIENALSGLPNLERVTSRSQEGSSRVTLEFSRGTALDEAANDLRSALDRLRDDLPVEADAPQIFKLDLDRIDVVSLAVTSTRPMEELTRILENDLSRRFEQIPGVGAISVRGGVHREIRIELERDRLRATGLTALDVVDALGQNNLTLPGGDVKSGTSNLYVRAQGEYRSVDEIARTVVRTLDGAPVRVRDLATVRDGYEEVQYLSEINGVPAVTLRIQKQSGANTVRVAEEIRREVERVHTERDDLYLTVISDQSEFIRQSIDSVRTAGLWGSLLAILTLYFFLRNRSSTVIIALAIPISVISTFGLLYFAGLTLNQMTFGGLALGVGLMVDNAIVVLESIVRKREEEDRVPEEAARIGAWEVAGAIVASTLTTSVIFLPVVFTSTTSGALFQALALVVVFALLCSLLVALTLVPMLASRFLRLGLRRREGVEGRRRRSVTHRLETWYVEKLRGALRRRRLVFAVTLALLLAAVLALPRIPVELAPPLDSDEIDVEIEMAQGTNIAVVRAYLDELEQRVRETLPSDAVEVMATEVRGSNAEVELSLVPQDRRPLSSEALAAKLRAATAGEVPGAEIEVQAQSGLWMLRRVFSSGGGDRPIELELKGWDLERADELAAEIQRRMETVPGVGEVRLSRREGQPEENLIFDRERIAELGLSIREVARTVQANLGGLEASRLRDGGDEYPITVRLRSQDRLNSRDLDNIALRTPQGASVPLSAVVERQRGRAPVSIERVDGQRVTYLRAGLAPGAALGDVVEAVREELVSLPLPEGFSLTFGGEYREQLEAQRDFGFAIIMALVLVYMLMAAQFERFVDPLIVMASVPVALIGVVPTLLLTGTTLNLQSVMGLVMLIGIVVNNAIVLVDAVNLLRRDHNLGAAEATIEAARLRLRPILMTTTSTVLGLLPLAVGIGPGAELQASLARVVVGGLLASTLVTLVLIPLLYTTVATAIAKRKADRWRGDDSDQSRYQTA